MPFFKKKKKSSDEEKEKQQPIPSPLLVAAIDFGTTYSGWAFSFKHDFEKDPTKIFARNWNGETLVSTKAPTCVLINPDGKTFHSFGYEAETKYAELAVEDKHRPWYFFRRFKMMLFDKMKIRRMVTLEDETGKTLPAKFVFALVIEFLKDDILKHCQKQLADMLKEDEIQWVLTVPAIWNDVSKQFMRVAAEEAGILSSTLKIALEPEAASLYCRYLPVQKGVEGGSLASFTPGMTYFILDAGGGTVDIAVHQVIEGGKLRELHRASGGDWGGTMVDKAYEQFLTEIAGPEAFHQFTEEHMDDYIDMFRTFEIKKRETKSGQLDKVTFRIPPSFADTIQNATGLSIKEKILSSSYRDQVIYINGKLRIDTEINQSFFKKPMNSIIQHLSSLLQKDVKSKNSCTAIVMVGGFSESTILQDSIKKQFGGELKVIIPDGAGLAVLKGAVIFGHQPVTIAERICKFTYGQDTSHITSKACSHDHPLTKTSVENGQLRCLDIFLKHVSIGQTVKLNEKQKEIIVYPIYPDQIELITSIYASTMKDPCLATDPWCIKIGEFKIPIPDTTLGTRRQIGTRFIFGDTEIAVQVEDKTTGQIHFYSIDFLE